jgi:hypothetical protein
MRTLPFLDSRNRINANGTLNRRYKLATDVEPDPLYALIKQIQSMRVGQGLSSDAKVRRLIDRLCKIMDHRKKLCAVIAQMRSSANTLLRSVEADLYVFSEELDKITSRIDIDWLNNADEGYARLAGKDLTAMGEISEENAESPADDKDPPGISHLY